MFKKIDGLDFSIPKEVYDPAEDSFLLAENIVIGKKFKVLEIGSGSGYVSIFLAKKYPFAEYYSIDINFIASKITKENALRNNIQLEVMNGDLFHCFRAKNNPIRFDVVLFNSPYLPVNEEGLLERAWSGGKDGLEIVSQFIENLTTYLTDTSSCYLVVSSKTNLNKLNKQISDNNLRFRIIDKIAEGRENILLYEVKLNKNTKME